MGCTSGLWTPPLFQQNLDRKRLEACTVATTRYLSIWVGFLVWKRRIDAAPIRAPVLREHLCKRG